MPVKIPGAIIFFHLALVVLLADVSLVLADVRVVIVP
jgi:hypothetical protein